MPTFLAEASTSPASRPADADVVAGYIFLGVIVLLAVAGLLIAVWKYKVLRPSRVAGPDRAPWPLGVWPLWVGVGASIIVFFAVSTVLVMMLRPRMKPGEDLSFGDADLAILSVVPPALCFIAIAGIIALTLPGTLAAIGFSLRTLPRGLKLGLLASLAIIPWVFLISQATEIVYRITEYRHPEEHELLRVMTTPEEIYKWLAILGAVLVAPIWEEFFFRGLLQTAVAESLLRLFYPIQVTPVRPSGFEVLSPPAIPSPGILSTGMTSTAMPPPGMPPTVPPTEQPPLPGEGLADSAFAPPQASLEGIPLASAPFGQSPFPPDFAPLQVFRAPHSRAWAAWVSIFLTSLLFALVHPLWTAPIIFSLSLGLGYVYERSGKLWVSMTVHAAFNIISTALYLSLH